MSSALARDRTWIFSLGGRRRLHWTTGARHVRYLCSHKMKNGRWYRHTYPHSYVGSPGVEPSISQPYAGRSTIDLPSVGYYHPRDGRSRQRLARLSGSLRSASAVRGAGFEPAFPRCSRRFFQLNQPPHLMVTSHRRTNPPRALQCPLCGGGTSALISGSHVPGNSPLQRCPDIEGTTGHDPATFWVEARRSTN